MTLSGKVNVSVERIRMFDPLATGLMDEPYYVAYSGGKDSDALRILFEIAGVRYDLWHNHTTADAPETVRYVRTIPNVNISYPAESMWQLIVNRRMPPTRMMRYCCEVLKERGGARALRRNWGALGRVCSPKQYPRVGRGATS